MTYRADIEQARMTRLRKRRLTFLTGLSLALLIGAVSGYVYWQSLFSNMPSLPDPDELWTRKREFSLDLMNADGERIFHRGPVFGEMVDPETLPDHVVQAFLAGEDKRFYDHKGVDIAAVFRAGFANWRAGQTVQGGSTLTQQVIKNLVLTPEQSIKRKAQEMTLALELEQRLSKNEILSLYLNRIYLGNRAFGVDGAAEAYFNKNADELTLAEASFIASLPKAPSRMISDPDLEDAKARQQYILSQMVDEDYITLEEAQAAIKAPIEFVERPPQDPLLNHVADHVMNELGQLLPTVPKDLVVTITIDPTLQGQIHAALKKTIDGEGKRLGARNGAALLMETNGRVLAMIGGLDYFESQFNRATQAMRQPGSSFKPFVYAAAMEKGLRPYTVRVDERVYITKDWAPRNYTNQYYGPVRLRDALANSLNTVSAKLTQEVGAGKVVEMAHRLGLGTDLRPFPSIALGSDETTLFDMVRAYGAFARSGKRMDPYMIEKIENTRGELIFERKPYPAATVLDKRVSADMNDMLSRVVTHGSGRAALIDGWEIAGKTGTSQKWRDAWFIGYTNSLIAGVWLGNDENEPMSRVSGGGLPARTWKAFMSEILEDYTPEPLPGFDGRDELSVAQQRRLDFYDELADAFRSNQPTQLASARSGSTPQ